MARKKTFTFQVGDRVGEFFSEIYEDDYSDPVTVDLVYDPDNGPVFGVVTALSSDGQVKVKWDGEDEDFVEANTLAPEKVVKDKLSVLEQEFKEVMKDLKVKMKEASKALKEANKLAKSKLGRNLNQLGMGYDGGLYDAMDAAGWRTSSFGC